MSIENNDIDIHLHKELMSITDNDKDISIRNLLKSELQFGKTNHILVCYHSDTSRTFAKTIQSSLKAAFGNSLVICNHEEDFLPGCSIVQNITTAIRESIKVVLILSEAFINSSWCNYEAECTLRLKLDMKESKIIIPLCRDKYSLINKPTFLKPFSAIDCTSSPDIWYPKLIEGLNTEIKHWKQLTEPPSLATGKEYHFVTFIDSESNSECDNMICQVLKELEKDGFIGNILSMEHLSTLESFQVVDKIVFAFEKTSKILIFSHEKLTKNLFYLALINLVKMFIEDKRIPTTYIIPVKLDGASFPVLGDTISYLDVGITDGYLGKLKDAIARTGEYRFCFPDEAIISFENDIFRVADFECPRTEGDDKDPRILDMCFIRRDTRPHLIIIDADNMKVKFLSVLGNECIDGYTFAHRPNRLSKINEDSFALIYENNLDIAIFDIDNKAIRLRNILKVDSCVNSIKSLVAFSDTHFLITNGSHCYSIINDRVNATPTDKSPAMSLARRLTKSNSDDIFIADENDRRLIWLDISGNTLFAQSKWNRNLYNVRGITSGKNKIYAAVNNAVVVFKYVCKSRSSSAEYNTQLSSQSSDVGHDTPSSSQSSSVGHDTPSASHSSYVGHDTPSSSQSSSVGHDTPSSSQSPIVGHHTTPSSHSSTVGHNTPSASQSSSVGHDTPSSSQSSYIGHDTPLSSQSPTVGHNTPSASQSSSVGYNTPLSTQYSSVDHDTPSSTQYSSVGHDTQYLIHEEAIRLIKFQRPIDHNRAICLDYSEQYLALSQVINGKDIIRIFKLHSNTSH